MENEDEILINFGSKQTPKALPIIVLLKNTANCLKINVIKVLSIVSEN